LLSSSPQTNNNNGSLSGGIEGEGEGEGEGGDGSYSQEDVTNGYRYLQEEEERNLGQGFITFTKVFLVIAGIVLSLLIHFLKMIIRISSLMCSGGCCQPCITILEVTVVVGGISFAILSPIFAVLACIALLVAAGYVIKVKFCKEKDGEIDVETTIGDNNNNNAASNNDDAGTTTTTTTTTTGATTKGLITDGVGNHSNSKSNNNKNIDVENPLTASTAPPPIEVTAQLVNVVNGHLSSGEFLKNDEITIPLPAPIGAPLPTSTPLAKPDLEATTY